MKDTVEERTVGSHTIHVDRTVCIGSGNCAEIAPEVFVLGQDQVITFVTSPADIAADRLVEACAICPVDALIMTRSDGKQIVP